MNGMINFFINLIVESIKYFCELVKVMFTSIIKEPILVCMIIIGLLLTIFQAKILGWFGEHWTKKALKKLPKEIYTIINNVFIYVNGSTHQIDHVVVSPYGIFSIETKQYNGFIVGNKYDKNWVRYIGKNKIYYSNPIRQNYGHVKSLSKLLNIDESKIYNIVCIPSRANLKIKHDGEIVRYDTIANKIQSYGDVIINNTDEIVDIINQNNIKDRKILKQHNKNIREKIIDKDQNKCPRCGGNLVERHGQYGRFIGCSNYPKCRYTRK